MRAGWTGPSPPPPPSPPVSPSGIQYKGLETGLGMKHHSLRHWPGYCPCVHARDRDVPFCSCSASLAHDLFHGATFKLHFLLICRSFRHSLCKLQGRSMVMSGRAFFANIYWAPGAATETLPYISKNIISHAQPISSRRSWHDRTLTNQTRDGGVLFFSHLLPLFGHGRLFFCIWTPLLLLLFVRTAWHDQNHLK